MKLIWWWLGLSVAQLAWASQPDPQMLATVGELRARAGTQGSLAEAAQVWLEFAQEEFIELDQTGVAEDALARARQLVEWIEHKQPMGAGVPEPVRGTERVRSDLWGRMDAVRGKPCAQHWLVPAEVYLIWAGHEQPELGKRHARHQEDEAEQRVQQAERCSEPVAIPSEPVAPSAKPSPLVPVPPPVLTPPPVASDVPRPWERVPNVVHFATDRATLNPTSREVLQQVVATLRAYPGLRLTLGGHADARGNAGYNLRLSQRRVQQVYQHLRALGVDAARLEVQAFGMQHSLSGARTAFGQARDRRVELRFINPQAAERVRSETQEHDLQK